MLYESIKKLVQYGIDTGITPESERIYTTNLLLDVMKEDDYEDYEQVLERVMAAIRRFPPQTRRVFTDCVFRHLSYKETAEHLGISPLTVKTLMARALKQLRQQKEFFSPVVVLLLHAFSVL